MDLIKIEITEEDAKLFTEFQRRYIFMKMLESVDAFEIKNGSVTIHFNNLGEVGSIDVNKHLRLP